MHGKLKLFDKAQELGILVYDSEYQTNQAIMPAMFRMSGIVQTRPSVRPILKDSLETDA